MPPARHGTTDSCLDYEVGSGFGGVWAAKPEAVDDGGHVRIEGPPVPCV